APRLIKVKAWVPLKLHVPLPVRARVECAPDAPRASSIMEPEFKVRLFARVSVPLAALPVPPSILAPFPTVTVPLIVPVPPNVVPLLLTETALPPAVLPLTNNVAEFTVVAPVYVFVPPSVNVPLPL